MGYRDPAGRPSASGADREADGRKRVPRAPGEIVITAGCQEAVSLALLTVCSPGDTVAIESPAYFSFIQQLERLRLNGIEIPVTPSEGISLEALEYALEHAKVAACLVTANFSNPIGSLDAG